MVGEGVNGKCGNTNSKCRILLKSSYEKRRRKNSWKEMKFWRQVRENLWIKNKEPAERGRLKIWIGRR